MDLGHRHYLLPIGDIHYLGYLRKDQGCSPRGDLLKGETSFRQRSPLTFAMQP